jgi:hypothetical protein
VRRLLGGVRQRVGNLFRGRYASPICAIPGTVRRDCLARYLDALGLDSTSLAPLRALVWLIHAQSDYRHAAADTGGPPPPAVLARSLFLGLWTEEVRHIARG